MAAAATVASGTTTDIGADDATFLTISGTTTITGFGTVSAGIYKWLIFGGALTLTHNATSLILPTGANITTAAGDVALMLSLGSGNWRCLSYLRADGTPIVNGSLFPDGSVGTPGIRFTNDTDTGLYRIGANNIGIALSGTKYVDLATAAVTVSTDLVVPAGSEGNPSFTFTGSSLGLYASSTVIGVSDGASSPMFRFDNGNTRNESYYKLRLRAGLEFDNASGSPTVSAGGGTGVAIAGSDSAFVVTIGTGSPTSVTVDFTGTRPDTPIAVVSSSQSGLITHVSAISTTQVQIQSSAAMSSGTKLYCMIVGYV
jgi:hypothetical protein